MIFSSQYPLLIHTPTSFLQSPSPLKKNLLPFPTQTLPHLCIPSPTIQMDVEREKKPEGEEQGGMSVVQHVAILMVSIEESQTLRNRNKYAFIFDPLNNIK